MKTKFCTNCGAEIDEDWQNCPSCGIALTTNSPYAKHLNPFQARVKMQNGPEYKKPFQVEIFGLLALIFGIFGLIFGCGFIIFSNYFPIELLGLILEIIFGILAMVFGCIGLRKGKINTKAYLGLLLGGFELVIFWYLIPFFFR